MIDNESDDQYDVDADIDDYEEPCPECGTNLEAKWSGVECPNCCYTFCL